ncbi:hypothetical protein V6N11_068014 [Hibiscus sabdariffa]|uniref:RNase H type-1 domain-containing protein n=1 Tax=Hibiscus sabdariffa TaxID=183260 RepID=A0ABR2SSG0_9ROSI
MMRLVEVYARVFSSRLNRRLKCVAEILVGILSASRQSFIASGRNAIFFGGIVDEWGSIIMRSRWLADATRNALAGRRSLSQPRPAASLPAPCWSAPPSSLLRPPFLKGSPNTLVRDIRRMCNQDWQISFHHVSRIGNRVADS